MKAESGILSAPQDLGRQALTGERRVVTIDILRALTMVLMIFVNDLWSLTNIPAWLGHVDAGVDGMGLSDVVFPAFLFIVGLSIPYAIAARRRKGEQNREIILHVLWRTIALLVMGVFLVNGEGINAEATGLPRVVWGAICCVCFILIWNSWPPSVSRMVVYLLRGLSIATLLYLAFIYRGGPDDALRVFGPRWWGILGLIGWAYLVSTSIAVAAGKNIVYIAIAWGFFSLLSMITHAGLFPPALNFIPDPIRGGTLVALTLGGVLSAMIFHHYQRLGEHKKLTLILAVFAAGLIILSLITRPYWGLAKLGATPAWLFLCSAFTILAFLAIYWLADVSRKGHWFDLIKPAGTATLLCYLIPYFAYFTTYALGISLPEFLLDGGVGLLKSFLFALLCVFITGLLVRIGVRVKL